MDFRFNGIRSQFPNDYQNRFQIFYDLQKYKITEVLLVSSLYDDFILEEDGRLSEELTQEYSDLELSSPPPRIIRVSNAKEALHAIEVHHFDLIITMLRLSDMDPFSFGKAVKKKRPDLPVVLLLSNHSDTLSLPPYEDRYEAIDEIFTFNGDADLFLAIIKIIEDQKNVENDTQVGGVRVILVVEDTINYYSIFLPIIYKVLLQQTQEVMEEGLNTSHKLLRRRARPKILLAQTYEEATSIYTRYNNYLLGVITDVAFPISGTKDFQSGVKLIKFIRSEKKHLPVLIQSSDPENAKLTENFDAWFVHKTSWVYLRDFTKFLRRGMLFGEFIFRESEEGDEIARAKGLVHFEKVLKGVSAKSVHYHSSKNHFSNWLYSRGENTLADQLAPFEVDEFESIEALRQFLIQSFENKRKEKERDIIADFQREKFDFTTPFTRIGIGSLGGKGRGIAFINSILLKQDVDNAFPDVSISIPETVVLATDIFDLFIEENNLLDILQLELSDEEVKRRFLSGKLPEGILMDIDVIIRVTNQPLAVRSSSLLEDSQFHPLAGVYTTYMLSNDSTSVKVRTKQLRDAIKLVYASAFTKEAKSYIRSMGQRIEVEKMAVVIQKVVGKKHETRFYPDFSGVTKSYNYYPIRHMKPEDGIAEVAVGLGEMVVSGNQFLSFSPEYPNILPQASTVQMTLKNTQREFLAIKLKEKEVDLTKGETSTLAKLSLDVAKEDGVLKWLGAIYDHTNNRIVNTLHRNGVIVITFPYILKYQKFPLSSILLRLLEIGQETLGYSTEIEFAVNLDYENETNHQFYVLQIRPLVFDELNANIDVKIDPDQDNILYSEVTLGNGIFEGITDIVYVEPDQFSTTETLNIRQEVGQINKKLRDQNRKYLLIGPGRWGSADRFLGIPVHWSDIDHAEVIAEVAYEDFQVEPSQGNHFFTNITSSKRAYFTIPYNSSKASINGEWFSEQERVEQLEYVSHIRLKDPLQIIVNGKTGQGIVFQEKP